MCIVCFGVSTPSLDLTGTVSEGQTMRVNLLLLFALLAQIHIVATLSDLT